MQDHQLHILHDSSILRIEDYCCRGGDAAPGAEERTSAHEVVFIRSGTYVRDDAFGSIVADVNHMLFFNAGQPYQIVHPVTGGDRSVIFAFAPHVLLDLLRDLDPTVDDRHEKPFQAGYSVVRPQQRLVQYALLEALGGAYDPLEIEEQALLLLADIHRHAFQFRHTARQQSRSITARAHVELAHHVKLVLGARFRQRLTLDEIARTVHISPYHLSRIFRRETGVSLHRYLQRIRLLNALEHLAEHPAQSITRLALDLGFNSHSHFTNAFHREFGLPPSAYRRSLTPRRLREMSKILQA